MTSARVRLRAQSNAARAILTDTGVQRAARAILTDTARLVVLASLACTAASGAAIAATPPRPGVSHAASRAPVLPARVTDLVDLGLFSLAPGDARTLALGGAALARGDDSSVLRLNPAALARVPRIEVRAGGSGARVPADAIPGGTRRTTGTRRAFSAAWPLPVVRGALVVGAGVFRAFDAAPDATASGPSPYDGVPTWTAVQRRGGADAWTLGGAIAIAPGYSVGASVDVLDGSVRTLVQATRLESIERLDVLDDVTWEIDGVAARAGLVAEPARGVRAAAVVELPGYVNASGEAVVERVRTGHPGGDSFTRTREHRNVDVVLPARFSGALAVDFAGVGVELAASRADWSGTTVDRRRLVTSTLDEVLGTQTSLRASIEWTLPRLPLRLRGGWARTTYPARYDRPDRTVDAVFPVDGRPQVRAWSVGLGWLVAQRVRVDVAWARGRGDVRSRILHQPLDADRFALSITWRRAPASPPERGARASRAHSLRGVPESSAR